MVDSAVVVACIAVATARKLLAMAENFPDAARPVMVTLDKILAMVVDFQPAALAGLEAQRSALMVLVVVESSAANGNRAANCLACEVGEQFDLPAECNPASAFPLAIESMEKFVLVFALMAMCFRNVQCCFALDLIRLVADVVVAMIAASSAELNSDYDCRSGDFRLPTKAGPLFRPAKHFGSAATLNCVAANFCFDVGPGAALASVDRWSAKESCAACFR